MDTKAVIDHHLEAFAAGDLDEVMADYTEDSLFIARGRRLKGLEAIRASFEALLSGPFAPGTYTMEMEDEQIEGEVGYIIWHADLASATVPIASDTFIVRDGKIVLQTVAIKLDPK